MNRRSFLQLTAAAGATPGKVRAGILGTQHSHAIGKLRVMRESADYEVAAVCEPDAAARKQRESEGEWRGVRFVGEEELLGDRSIRLIVVECRAWDAMALGRKVIAAGKHLHLEKPPINKMAPFKELVEQAKRKKLLLQMGYLWRFHAGITAAIEAARAGWLGDVHLMRGTIHTDLSPQLRDDTAHYRGGMMYELGGHQIDRVVDLFGRPREVRSWIRHDSKIPDRLADNTLAVLEYDRALAVISTSARMPGATLHRSFELIGTDGAVLIQPVEPGTRMRVSMREARGPYKAGWQEIEFPAQPRYVGDLQDMARAIKTGQPLKYSYDHELLLQETLLRASGEVG